MIDIYRQMLTPEGFNDRVNQLTKGCTRRKAYDMAEVEFEEFYGATRYSSYESFKSSISYSMRKKCKKTAKRFWKPPK